MENMDFNVFPTGSERKTTKYSIKELPIGMIIWNKNNILEITGATLPQKYYEYYCTKIIGNDLDFELVERIED